MRRLPSKTARMGLCVPDEQLITVPLEDSVKHYAQVAQQNGADGVVCSANEAQMMYQTCGEDFLKITPGIRLAGESADDQKRVMTPGKAAQQHSSGLVGRSITQAAPAQATQTAAQATPETY